MKKLTTGVLAGAMLLSLGAVSASATTPTEDVEITRDFSINIEEKANEAGLTVEEYLAEMEFEFGGEGKGVKRGKMPFGAGERPEFDGERPEFDGERPEFDGERPENMPSQEDKQAMLEEKATEAGLTIEEYVEQMKAEQEAKREAMLEEKATEAGLTVEEYVEQMKAEQEAKREAMLEEKATEAGLTIEEYVEQMKENASFGGKKNNRNQ